MPAAISTSAAASAVVRAADEPPPGAGVVAATSSRNASTVWFASPVTAAMVERGHAHRAAGGGLPPRRLPDHRGGLSLGRGGRGAARALRRALRRRVRDRHRAGRGELEG